MKNEKWFRENWYKENCDCVACSHYRALIRIRNRDLEESRK